MKRRDFLSKLSIGAAVAVAAPQVVKAVTKKEGLVVEKEVPEEVYDVYQNSPTPTWLHVYNPFKLTAKSRTAGDMTRIDFDTNKLNIHDIVYIDPPYTNKVIPCSFMVLFRGSGWAIITPLDASVTVERDMPEGTIIFTGPNIY